MDFQKLALPTENPILVFLFLLLIILIAPILLRRISIPGIMGLIVAGVIIGPYGFHLIDRNLVVVFFGKIGLLYLMFLASLELDLQEFKNYQKKSVIFGILTFIIPFAIGIPVSIYFLKYDVLSSILIASLFSTHTLVAYPIVSRLGIQRNEVVSVAVGGTVITDTLVLLILAVVNAYQNGKLGDVFLVKMIISMAFFVFIVLWVFPKLARWFFKNAEPDKIVHFLFVLILMIFASLLAELSGMDGIIGAFFAGLSLSRLIPHTSPIKSRIEFVGNSLFIPIFLIGVGMTINLNVVFGGTRTIIVASVLMFFAFLTKWLAAFFTQKIFNYTKYQRKLLFGLSSTHAAAILAVIVIGFKIGLLDEHVLNGTILLILVTCVLGSFITDKAGKAIAIREADLAPVAPAELERILVPIANPSTLNYLIELSVLFRKKNSKESIYFLSIVNDDANADIKVLSNKKLMAKATAAVAESDIPVRLVAIVDLNVSSGIRRAVKEHTISTVIMGWSRRKGTSGFIFGTTLDNVIHNINQEIVICKLNMSLNLFRKVYVLIPTNSSYEPGFKNLFYKFNLIIRQIQNDPVYYSDRRTLQLIKSQNDSNGFFKNAEYIYSPQSEKFQNIFDKVENSSLLLIMLARKSNISFTQHHELLPQIIDQHFDYLNVVIGYPRQLHGVTPNVILPEEDIGLDPIQDNIDRIRNVRYYLKNLIKKK